MKKISIFGMQCIIKILKFLYSLGIHSSLSGWRKSMGIYLRREESKFVLSTFSLKMGNKEELIKKLMNELRNDPEMQWRVIWRRNDAYRVKNNYIDIVETIFDKTGTIQQCIPYFDEFNPIQKQQNDIKKIVKEFIEYYNQTLFLSDEKRPLVLYKLCYHSPIMLRLLNSHMITFSKLPNNIKERFTPFNFIKTKHFGLGLLNIHAQLDENRCDLWIQYQHIAVDGVPMQQFLCNLENKYQGVPIIYPNKNELFPLEQCSDSRGEKTVYQTITFISFDKLVEFRKQVNIKYHIEMGGKATFAGLLIWALGNSEIFKGEKFMFPVNVPEDNTNNLDSEPSGIFITPSHFYNANKPLNGLLDFQREFNSQIEMTRKRQSKGYKLVEYFGILPASLYALPPKLIPETVNEFVGAIGLTILRDANVFIPPAPLVQPKGFFAIGSLSRVSESGKTVGCVGLRGTKKHIENNLIALKQIDSFYNINNDS
jgi:hypothetical protein